MTPGGPEEERKTGQLAQAAAAPAWRERVQKDAVVNVTPPLPRLIDSFLSLRLHFNRAVV